MYLNRNFIWGSYPLHPLKRLDKSVEQTQFFQVITIENNQLSYTAYTAIGGIYDQMTIQKNFKTEEKKLLENGKL